MTKKETTSEITARLILHESQQSPERTRSANISRTAYETNVRKLRGEKEENSDNFGGKKAPPFKKGNDAHDGAEDSDFTKKKDDEDKDENSDNFGGKKAPPFKKGGGTDDDEDDDDDDAGR